MTIMIMSMLVRQLHWPYHRQILVYGLQLTDQLIIITKPGYGVHCLWPLHSLQIVILPSLCCFVLHSLAYISKPYQTNGDGFIKSNIFFMFIWWPIIDL